MFLEWFLQHPSLRYGGYVLIFLLLIGKSVLSQNFMMNCVSPDFKSMAFYKYNESKSALFVRPMKSRWTDFCQDNQLDEKDITCKFNGLVLYRSSVNGINDITYKINFYFTYESI